MELVKVENLCAETDILAIGETTPYNFSLFQSEVVLIPSGKTASQLGKIVFGAGKINSGSINYNKIFDYNPFEITWRKKLGYAHRDKGLIANRSIFENVAMPVRYYNDDIKLAEKALEDAGVDRIYWNVRPHQVSWPIRKRTTFARAVVMQPKIVFLDDPTVLFPFEQLNFVFSWIMTQKERGTCVLIGTDDIPFALSLCDWALCPKTHSKTTDFENVFNKEQIEIANVLKRQLLESRKR